MLNQQEIYKWPVYNRKVQTALEEFCRGDSFHDWNLGDIYTQVPQLWAESAGANHGIFCSSGTSALHAILLALGLKEGDEIIIPSMTFIRAATPMAHLGVQPVCVDIDPETGNISPTAIEQAITSKTKAILAVHMWGVPAQMDAICRIAQKAGIMTIEDFSHAHFSSLNDQFVGSFGDFSFGSLQRKKTLSVGEGGIIFCKDKADFEKLQEITSPGSFPKDLKDIDFAGFGLNLRMSPFSAVVAKQLFLEKEKVFEKRKHTAKELISIMEDSGLVNPIGRFADREVNWYSLRPQAKHKPEFLSKPTKLWKFRPFGYSCVFDSSFWERTQGFLAFKCPRPPMVRGSLENTYNYLNNRFTVEIPNLNKDYWNEETRQEWRDELIQSFRTNSIASTPLIDNSPCF